MRLALIAVLFAITALAAVECASLASRSLRESQHGLNGNKSKNIRAVNYRLRRQSDDADAESSPDDNADVPDADAPAPDADADADAPAADGDADAPAPDGDADAPAPDAGADEPEGEGNDAGTDTESEAPPAADDGGGVAETPAARPRPPRPLGLGPPNGYQYKTQRRIRYRRIKRQSDDDGEGILPPFEDNDIEKETETEKPEAESLDAPNAEDGPSDSEAATTEADSENLETDTVPSETEAETPQVDPETPAADADVGSEPAEPEAATDAENPEGEPAVDMGTEEETTPESSSVETPSPPSLSVQPPLSAKFGDDGYRYRTLRRIRYKRRRRQTPGYLPPAGYLPADDDDDDVGTQIELTETTVEADDDPLDLSAVFGADGYQYKTQRRIRYKRRRRDV